eukprot:TRINITY_DN9245_c0_g1_i1.p1 TRINITY_DN9245_c0_g1~~TRINITY_DN9245_c0_g1_i1.p1  ORF type:complete len:472 (+),score=155.00 TRINITY_DN9245_c0_g1_i1:158-1417(+)
MEGYYDNTIFHRIVKDFLIQGGDPTGTGEGGESIYDEHFKDEYHSRLRFTHRGILACASFSKNKNASQFFITLDATQNLDKKHTIFGKVTGETIFNLLAVNGMKCKGDRPKNPPKIIRAEILLAPFDDIVPRVKEIVPEVVPVKEKVAGVYNKKLLSFVDDEDEEEEEAAQAPKFKMISAHVALPAKKKKKKKGGNEEDEEEEVLDVTQIERERKTSTKSTPSTSASSSKYMDRERKAREEKEKQLAKVQEETKALLNELKVKKDKEKKRSREEMLKEEGRLLLLERQQKYLSNKKQKNMKDIESDLSLFVSNLHKRSKEDEARERRRKEEEDKEEALARAEAKEREERARQAEGDDEDEDWLGHKLNFAKDLNPIVDLNTIEQYTYDDPLELRKATEGDIMYNEHQRRLKAQKNVETW